MSLRILVTGASGFVGGAFLRRFQGQPGLDIHGIGRRACALPNYHRIDLSQPFVDAMLPEGHRLHVVLEGISRGFSAA